MPGVGKIGRVFTANSVLRKKATGRHSWCKNKALVSEGEGQTQLSIVPLAPFPAAPALDPTGQRKGRCGGRAVPG